MNDLICARPKEDRLTVLVVDDSPDMQRYLRCLLEVEDYQVEVASNGREAVQRLRQGCSADIVLLDVQMPGMDGLKTLRQLRQLQPKLKVIMCSGVDDPKTIEHAASLGAQGYITKPVRHLYLSAALARCLKPEPPSPDQLRADSFIAIPSTTSVS